MTTTVLVANRGEIALRVFRTAASLGMRTAAIYTDADRSAPHVRAANVALRVPSYLDIDAVVAAAKDAGADIVHPGYGFLSERSAFATALATAGPALAGPSPDVMELMGRKDAAREVAVAAGVPVLPSYAMTDDPSTFSYPILIKAAAGGGGKGMRVVRELGEFAEALLAAAREARTAFGDDTLLIERYVESGRHIEVQVMADRHGTVLHLWERDCSTQRRHQKVLEEAPAPTIDETTRTGLTQAAVDLARKVGYVGAGTVEFLLDSASGDFYFLEMNTRLQVEHPVTEAITGLDLVALQLRVALGEALGIDQADVRRDGWAIEARVYAEDAFGGFLPQAGTATYVHWPASARCDHSLESGQRVTTSYDPMLGKIIVHGADREAARAQLLAALDDTAILGLTTNAGFLRALAATDEFRDATIDTAWLDHYKVEAPTPDDARALAAWTLAGAARQAEDGPFAADGFRSGGEPEPIAVSLDERALVDLGAATVDGRAIHLTSRTSEAGVVRLVAMLDGRASIAYVRPDRRGAEAVVRGQRYALLEPELAGATGSADGTGVVVAPMPGSVIEVRVAAGDRVEAGDVLGVVEAMKMELALRAKVDGLVRAVHVGIGDQVSLGRPLFEVEAEED